MKLATYRDGSRDGQLVVVSRDLSIAHYASGIATKLQQVLDDWNFVSPQLQELSQNLNHGKTRHAFSFDPQLCMAPLPRAYQWANSNAYRKSADSLHANLEIHHAASDALFGPHDHLICNNTEQCIDFGAGLAAITDDQPTGVTPEDALQGVRLLALVNDVGGLATSFSPVAVTPDELGSAWQTGRVHLNLECTWNSKRVGLIDTGIDMVWHFGHLISHLCQKRSMRTGSILGSGTVSSQDSSRGYACIANKRSLESTENGAPKTRFMQPGDSIRLEMKGTDGLSVFGAIDQKVIQQN
jgi:fumarylacetoacetate (FAA) hydrolase